jgi:hypothetical protein
MIRTIKKVPAITLALAIFILLATGVVVAAQETESGLRISGGIDMLIVPLQLVTRDTALDEGNLFLGAGLARNGAMQGVRTRLTLFANHENRFGFRSDLMMLYTNNRANLWGDSASTNPSSPNNAPASAIDFRVGDHMGLWWRPIETLRIDAGRFFFADHSGYVNDHWLAPWTIGMFDGGNIFSGWFANTGVLARYTVAQVQGLSVAVFVPQFGMPFMYAPDSTGSSTDWPYGNLVTSGGDRLNDTAEEGNRNLNRAMRVFQRTWLTLGYEAPNSYHARLQFIGANPSGSVNFQEGEGANVTKVEPFRYRVTVTAPRIEAAFAYLGVQDFVIDVGVKSWLPVSDWITDTYSQSQGGYIRLRNTGTYWGGIGFGLGVSYRGLLGGDLIINLRADGDMLRQFTGVRSGEEWTIVNPLRMSFHLWPQYRIEGVGTLTVNAGLNYVGRNSVTVSGATPNPNEGSVHWQASDRLRFGAGAALTVPLAGVSSVSFGLAYRHGTTEGRGAEPMTISLPINFFMHF